MCVSVSAHGLVAMTDEGSSVTLIFYRINPKWWTEPALNLASAVAQMSNLTHCEISIGEDAGVNGTMKHVARVFNDNVGVELVHRTGRNPQNLFVQLGCSKMAEQKMLHYVKTQCVGKPFSNYAMVRSLFWPRETTHESFFCAELVASILKVGGLLDANCNPGSATPEMLYRIYSPRAAVSANPCLLRELHQHSPVGSSSNGFIGNLSHAERLAERESLVPHVSTNHMVRPTAAAAALPPKMALVAPQAPLFQPARRRADSPPRGHFQVVSKQYAPLGSTGSACSSRCPSTTGLQLTMNSLQFGGGTIGGGSSSGVKPRPR